jgi:hypothetical protein
MHKERINVTDFESDHFAAQLVERLGWAVSDANDVERTLSAESEPIPERPPAANATPRAKRALAHQH